MTMQPPLFCVSPDEILSDKIHLPEDEAHHATKVLRLKAGAAVVLVDGQGTARRGAVVSVRSGRVVVEGQGVIRNFGEPAVKLTLAAGLSAGSKLDSIVQKGTELGVSRFVPIQTLKSKVKLEETSRARRRVVRLERVALAAMKQCRRSFRPEVSLPVSLPEFLSETNHDDIRLVFHPAYTGTALSELSLDSSARRATLLIGPESGFDEEEISAALAAGFLCVNLGERILRTETAAPIACALLLDSLGEFR